MLNQPTERLIRDQEVRGEAVGFALEPLVMVGLGLDIEPVELVRMDR